MNQNGTVKIAIIGFGFLMSYLEPCYTQFFSREEQAGHIIAVTADEVTLAAKREKYPFPILLHDNKQALERLEPTVILFAPPPSVAPGLARDVLEPYYDGLRKAGKPLPDLYAFPPSPQGEFYLELLGEDVNVCNILPNMTREIAGRPLHGAEGNTYITIPEKSPWPEDNRQFLKRFFGGLGEIIFVSTKKIRDLLASLCVAEVMPLILFDIADALQESGKSVDSKCLASSMRASHQEAHGFRPKDTDPCFRGAVDSDLAQRLAQFCANWSGGARDFLRSRGIDEADAARIVVSNCDLRLHIAQCERRQEIERALRSHATPGGVAERGRMAYELLASRRIRDFFRGAEREPDTFYTWVRCVACEIGKIVAAHGRRLAGESVPVRFSPEHHAVLYGLFVRNAAAMAGADGRDAAHQATLLYARQRGGRMAKRVARNNEPLDCLHYMAYSEWSPEPGTMRAEDVCFQPEVITHAYVCPWFTTWQRMGFVEEGKEYCKYIDYHLVKGYNPDLTLNVTSTRPEGGEYCEFVWSGYAMDEAAQAALAEKKRRLGDSCKKDWVYHTRHLLSAMSEKLRELDMGQEIIDRTLDDFEIIYGAQARSTIMQFAEIDFYEA